MPKPLRALARTSTAALAAAFALLLYTQAHADTVSTTASAEIVGPGTLVNDKGLDFGTIATAGAGGSMSLSAADGDVTTTGDLAVVGSNPPNRALFKASAPVGILLMFSGDPTVTLTRNGGTETMTALLSYDAGAGLIDVEVFGLPIGVQATEAEQEILVGGTLLVNSGQAEGTYEGEFSLTIAYL